MLQKLGEDEPRVEKPLAELDHLGHTDWVRQGLLVGWDKEHGTPLKGSCWEGHEC